MTPLKHLTVAAAGLVSVATLLLLAPDASACGGFFCSFQPIDQTGEQIVFALEEGKVTAHIQIAYEGEAKDFAWVVPVTGEPVIDVGPQGLFATLQQRTMPQWWLDWQFGDGQCGFWFAEADGAPTAGAGGGDDEVQVLAEKEVGPYNTVTLAANDPAKLLQWLNDNGFDQPEESLAIIDHYLDQGMNFVAVKLQQDAGTGDIQPLVLEMETTAGCVPLVLTRIAAAPDMPVLVFALGEHRAVPTNWFNVTVNEKKINWLNNGSNYDEVASAAIDEAAGHGFITEFAGEVMLTAALWSEGRYDTAKLATLSNPAQFLDEMLNQGFPRDSQLQALIRKHMPMPALGLPEDCQEEAAFYTWNKEVCLGFLEEGVFSAQKMAEELDERVVRPLEAAQKLLDNNRYITRLYTRVSPDEMTRDPMFEMNPDLPEVSNFHQAKAEGTCTEDGIIENVTITLENGESFMVEGPFQQWQPPTVWEDPAPGEPAAVRIEVLGTSGPPTLVDPAEVAAMDATIASTDPTHLPTDLSGGGGPVVTPPVTTGSGSVSGGPSGCGTGGPAPLDLGLLMVLALAGLAIRRRTLA